jgi:hypothetical protein
MKLQRKTNQRTQNGNIVLNINKEELAHLRDLMSVLMPPECKNTFSEELARINEIANTEEELWQKIHNLCASNGIPTDDAAPDFVVSIPQHPELTINKLVMNNNEQKNSINQKDFAREDNLELYDILMNKKKI